MNKSSQPSTQLNDSTITDDMDDLNYKPKTQLPSQYLSYKQNSKIMQESFNYRNTDDLETILYINDSVDDTTEIKTEEESNDSTFKRYCEKYNDSNIRII